MQEKDSMFAFLKEVIDKEYEICRILKESERGQVCVIRNRASGHPYVLRKWNGNAQAFQILKTFRLPYLPEIFEVAEQEGKVLALEEYITGDTLQMLLECGPLTKVQTRRITQQLCQALWTLHSHGLIHRDVKPDNVILRGDTAVLVDFDAARIRKESQETDTVVLGTVGYAAPEQFGISQTDGRADIYSLGILINLMLTGEHPSIRQASGKWGYIVRRCTMTNPQQRFRDVRQILRLL